MRVKMLVESVKKLIGGEDQLKLSCVRCGPDGVLIPSSAEGGMKIKISDPQFVGAFKPGQTFHLDFTETSL